MTQPIPHSPLRTARLNSRSVVGAEAMRIDPPAFPESDWSIARIDPRFLWLWCWPPRLDQMTRPLRPTCRTRRTGNRTGNGPAAPLEYAVVSPIRSARRWSMLLCCQSEALIDSTRYRNGDIGPTTRVSTRVLAYWHTHRIRTAAAYAFHLCMCMYTYAYVCDAQTGPAAQAGEPELRALLLRGVCANGGAAGGGLPRERGALLRDQDWRRRAVPLVPAG
eukprot:4460683-Pyramimonas_sp.AAC.1